MSSDFCRRAGGGERPPLSCASVVQVALAIADEEGLDAVSMRRVAQRLGVGTMTLYCHVRNKDDLLDLMWDGLIGEQLLEDVPADWRAGLTAIARKARASFLRHPWAVEVGSRSRTGANLLRHIEQSLAVTASLSSDKQTRLDVLAAVDDLVSGWSSRSIAWSRAGAYDTKVRWLRGQIDSDPALRALVESGELNHLGEALETDGPGAGPDQSEDGFERALRWLLDGVARELADRVGDRIG